MSGELSQDIEHNLEEQQIQDIVAFTKAHHLSSEDMCNAYEIALKVHDEKKRFPQLVYELAKKMDDCMNAGLPMNRIKSLIDSKEDFESAPRKYVEIVKALDINEKAKEVLRSIVQETRSGTLTIYEPTTYKIMMEMDIKKSPKNEKPWQHVLALELLPHLIKLKTIKFEVAFIPD